MRRPTQLVVVTYMTFPTPKTETAVPYAAFRNAGFEVKFATELGQPPVCDKKMIEGLTGKLLVRLPFLWSKLKI